jgi:hypothetical protein
MKLNLRKSCNKRNNKILKLEMKDKHLMKITASYFSKLLYCKMI